MSKPSVDRREFLRDLAGSAAALAIVPATAQAQPARTGPPKLRFAVIGINHSHINSQVNAVLRGGGELVSVFAKEPDLRAGLHQDVPAGEGGAERERDPRGRLDSAGPELGHPRRSRAARHPGDAARQGLHGRQAGHHHAGAARRGAQGPGARPSGSTRSCTASGSRIGPRSRPASW